MNKPLLDKYEPQTKIIIMSIKLVQQKMKEKKFTLDDLKDNDKYIDAYTSIAEEDKELSWFADTYPDMYKLVIKKGTNYKLIAEIVFYFDQWQKKKIDQKELAEFLKNVHWRKD
jgi:hypothetical protein